MRPASLMLTVPSHQNVLPYPVIWEDMSTPHYEDKELAYRAETPPASSESAAG